MHKFIPVLVIVALAFSLALKGGRYQKTARHENEHATRHDLADFLKSHGWQEAGPHDMTAQEVLPTYRYVKPRCHHPIFVAILGNNRELEGFARQSLGGEIGIFQDGRIVTNSNPVKLQAARARSQINTLLGLEDRQTTPIIAIHPKPDDREQPCDPPARKHWRKLLSRHHHEG